VAAVTAASLLVMDGLAAPVLGAAAAAVTGHAARFPRAALEVARQLAAAGGCGCDACPAAAQLALAACGAWVEAREEASSACAASVDAAKASAGVGAAAHEASAAAASLEACAALCLEAVARGAAEGATLDVGLALSALAGPLLPRSDDGTLARLLAAASAVPPRRGLPSPAPVATLPPAAAGPLAAACAAWLSARGPAASSGSSAAEESVRADAISCLRRRLSWCLFGLMGCLEGQDRAPECRGEADLARRAQRVSALLLPDCQPRTRVAAAALLAADEAGGRLADCAAHRGRLALAAATWALAPTARRAEEAREWASIAASRARRGQAVAGSGVGPGLAAPSALVVVSAARAVGLGAAATACAAGLAARTASVLTLGAARAVAADKAGCRPQAVEASDDDDDGTSGGDDDYAPPSRQRRAAQPSPASASSGAVRKLRAAVKAGSAAVQWGQGEGAALWLLAQAAWLAERAAMVPEAAGVEADGPTEGACLALITAGALVARAAECAEQLSVAEGHELCRSVCAIARSLVRALPAAEIRSGTEDEAADQGYTPQASAAKPAAGDSESESDSDEDSGSDSDSEAAGSEAGKPQEWTLLHRAAAACGSAVMAAAPELVSCATARLGTRDTAPIAARAVLVAVAALRGALPPDVPELEPVAVERLARRAAEGLAVGASESSADGCPEDDAPPAELMEAVAQHGWRDGEAPDDLVLRAAACDAATLTVRSAGLRASLAAVLAGSASGGLAAGWARSSCQGHGVLAAGALWEMLCERSGEDAEAGWRSEEPLSADEASGEGSESLGSEGSERSDEEEADESEDEEESRRGEVAGEHDGDTQAAARAAAAGPGCALLEHGSSRASAGDGASAGDPGRHEDDPEEDEDVLLVDPDTGEIVHVMCGGESLQGGAWAAPSAPERRGAAAGAVSSASSGQPEEEVVFMDEDEAAALLLAGRASAVFHSDGVARPSPYPHAWAGGHADGGSVTESASHGRSSAGMGSGMPVLAGSPSRRAAGGWSPGTGAAAMSTEAVHPGHGYAVSTAGAPLRWDPVVGQWVYA